MKNALLILAVLAFGLAAFQVVFGSVLWIPVGFALVTASLLPWTK